MTIKRETIVIKTCDICGKQVKDFAKASETTTEIIRFIGKQYWYAPEEMLDVCYSCSKQLIEFIRELRKKGL